jgi:hypothetical protein
VTVQASRTFPSFRQALIVVQDVPPGLMGDYHLQGGSPARQIGVLSKAGVSAPSIDYDGVGRPIPATTALDAGADERS